MPFQFRVYFKTLIQSFSIQAPWTLPRIGIMTFLFVIFPVLQVLNFIILMLDNVFFPGYRKVQIKNPVFIIGNARSGTTYIHRLMSLDKNFSSFKAWEIMFLAVSVDRPRRSAICVWSFFPVRRWWIGIFTTRVNLQRS